MEKLISSLTVYIAATLVLSGIGMATAPNYIAIKNNQPPTTPTINGPINGKIGETYYYTLLSTDPEGDNISYWIKWGENPNIILSGPFPSGMEIEFGHVWNETGTFTIKAAAEDTAGAHSDWGNLNVIVSKNQIKVSTWNHWLLEQHLSMLPIIKQLFAFHG
jgi:hypothetical protein